MKKFFFLLYIIVLFSPLLAQKTLINPEITAEEIKSHISFLASDELEGRMTGSSGSNKAGDYIRNEFQSNGLKPLFSDSYFQKFSFIEGVKLSKGNFLKLVINSEIKNLKLGDEFTPLSFSGNEEIKTGLVFVGYGLSVPQMQYDDYANINVKGKIVVVLNSHPEYDSLNSMFEIFSSGRQKASNAREKGAVGIIFVNGFYPEKKDELENLTYDGAPGIKDFCVVQVKRDFINKAFSAEGLDFSEYQRTMTIKKEPASFEFKNTSAEIKTGIEYIEKTASNVGGWLEGNDPLLRNEYILIVAHYDHIGWGEKYSRYLGEQLQIHNGADDNASGTSGVLELAEKFASIKDQLKRSIIFIAFTGEEMGVLGSNYFVSNSPVPLEKIDAMLNMDMIGRLNEENNLTIIGTGTSSIWESVINEKNIYELKLSLNEDGFGGSDHVSFTNKGIPVLFFFTGIHKDYHTPDDDADKINAGGEEKIVKFVFDIAYAVDRSLSKPDFVNVERKIVPATGGSKIRTGTIPEFNFNGKGYKIYGVTEGSPAQKAGLQAGDIIIRFAGKQIDNIYDFMSASSTISLGDVVEVIVLREYKEITFQLELSAE